MGLQTMVCPHDLHPRGTDVSIRVDRHIRCVHRVSRSYVETGQLELTYQKVHTRCTDVVRTKAHDDAVIFFPSYYNQKRSDSIQDAESNHNYLDNPEYVQRGSFLLLNPTVALQSFLLELPLRSVFCTKVRTSIQTPLLRTEACSRESNWRDHS